MLIAQGRTADRECGVSVWDVVGGIVAQGAAVVKGHCVCFIIQVIVVQVCARLENRVHSIGRQIRPCIQSS